jgi:hypothetical protein
VAGGIAGSILSQGVGIALGIQDSFSWSGVALGAISAGVAAAVGAVAPGIMAGEGTLAVASRAVVANAITQGIGVATGLQDHFSWASVAASGIGAGVGQMVGQGLQNTAFQDAFGKYGVAVASGFAGGAAAAVARGGRISVAQVAVDAFGNVIGSSIAEANWSGTERQSVSYGADEQAQDFARESNRFANVSAVNADSGLSLTTAQRQAMAMGSGPLTPEAANYMVATQGLNAGDIADGAVRVDKMDQPLNGRSNYNAWTQFGNIMSDAGKDSLGTTAGKLWDWATHTVPDADQRAAEIRARYGNDPRFAQIDQMRDSPLGAIGWLGARTVGASPAAQQMWLDIGTSADGFAMSGAALAGRAPAFTGARTMPELVGEPKLFETYNRTRINVEREMFRTPNDELSVVISRDTGSELSRQLISGTGGTLNAEMLSAMPGNTFTHFHPLGGNFSVSDIITGLATGAAEIRAVTPERTISLNFERAPSELLGNPVNAKVFLKSELPAIQAALDSAVQEGSIQRPDPRNSSANISATDLAVQTLANRNPWLQYTVTPTKR